MKSLFIFIAIVLIGGGALWAKGKVEKTPNGFRVKKVETYYQSQVSWGDGYVDHTINTPITGIAVLAVGTGWTYSAVTDEKGVFKIRVEPAKPFKVRISDGNTWVEYPTEIKGIAEGTIFNELP